MLTCRNTFLYVNMPESTQSCDCWVVKAVLRLSIDAASMPEYISGWCGHGFEFHSQHFADISRGWFKLMCLVF